MAFVKMSYFLRFIVLISFLIAVSCTSESTYSRKIVNNTGHTVHLAYQYETNEAVLHVPAFQEATLDSLNENPDPADSIWQDIFYVFSESDTSEKNIQQLSAWKFISTENNNGSYILEVDSTFFIYPTPEPPAPKDGLQEILDRGIDTLKYFGFEPHGKPIDTLNDINSNWEHHWYLQAFKNIYPRHITVSPPNENDYSNIKRIRTATFKKRWKVIVEEWEMKDEAAADRWMDIINNSSGNYYSKPPKTAWQEGKFIYFVMTTTAHDWFEYGDVLVETMKGKE